MKTIIKRSVCVILALSVLAFAVMTVVACGGVAYGASVDASGDITQIAGTKPALGNRISADDLAVIDAAIADGGNADAAKKAAMVLYNIANSSRIQDGNSLMLQESKMGIKGLLDKVNANMTLDDCAATVSMRGFTLKSGGDWYGEFVAQVDEGSGSMAGLMTFFSTMLKINYHRASEPDNYYFNIIKDSAIEADCSLTRFPFSSYKLIKDAQAYDLDGFKNAANILNAPNEIYNMDFMDDILSDVAITHEDGVYKVHFIVDPGADKALLEQWYRLPQKDMQEGGQSIKSYLKYVCDLEVWDNGYAKSYYAEYVRDAGMGGGITIDKFSYLWNPDEILGIISDDYRLDGVDEASKAKLKTFDDYLDFYISTEIVAAKMPPFYIALSVLGGIIFLIIVVAIVVEILVRKGKLPKLAAKREAKKQKRLAKKAAKKDTASDANDKVE